MKEKLKNTKRGITTLALVVVVILMILIMGTVTYVSTDSIKYKRVGEVQGDLRLISDRVNNYYTKEGKLPIKDAKPLSTKFGKEGTVFIEITELPADKVSKNDNDTYYLIDYDLFSGFSLNDADRAYVVNEKTHIIYVLRRIYIRRGNILCFT